MLHTGTVEPRTLELLNSFMAEEKLSAFKLVGGNSLSLRMGYRKSIDLDLFTEDDFDADSLYAWLKSKYDSVEIASSGLRKNTINGSIESVKIDFLSHAYPLIMPVEVVENIRFYAPEDIAAMKLNAISSRGARKDFWDLAYLLDMFNLPQMLDFYREKYNQNDVGHVVRSLAYFDDAEQSPNPVISLDNQSWKNIKMKISQAVLKLI